MTTHYLHSSAITLSLLFLAGLPARPAMAEEEHEHFEAHGGVGKKSDNRRFEIVFNRDSIRVYVSDDKGKPIDPAGAEGTIQVRFRQRGKNAVGGNVAAVPAKGKELPYLEVKVNLANVEEGAATAGIQLKKLPGGGEASFQEPFKLARLREWACPMNCVEPTSEAGKCAKCKMDLKERWFIYACPDHDKVTSREPGKCWIDKKDLVKQVSKGEAAHHGDEKGHEEGGHGGGHDDHGGGHGDHGGGHGGH